MSDTPILAALERLEFGLFTRIAQLEAGQTVRMDQLGTRMDQLDTRMDQLEAGQTTIRLDLMTRMDRLEAGQNMRMDRLETGQTTVRVELMARMDRLQDLLTAIRDDIDVNMGAADAMKRANDNTREMVRIQGEQMTVMWRQLKNLQSKVREITGDP